MYKLIVFHIVLMCVSMLHGTESIHIQKKYEIGACVWRECITEDIDKAKAFYGALFGWTFEQQENEPSLHIHLGAVAIGELRLKQDHLPTGWLSYCVVENIAEVVEQAQQMGGTIVLPVEQSAVLGSRAIITDLQGARIGVCTELVSNRFPKRKKFGQFCWEELDTHDRVAAMTFYKELFPWTMHHNSMGPAGIYTTLAIGKKGKQQIGGIMQFKEGTPAPTQWVPYILVKDVEAAVAQAVDELGGSIVVPVIDVPHGRFSVLKDNQGIVFYVWQNPTQIKRALEPTVEF